MDNLDKNQQLIRDIVFLEKLLLLDIESQNKLETEAQESLEDIFLTTDLGSSIGSQKTSKTAAKLPKKLLCIYAVLVFISPSIFDEANSTVSIEKHQQEINFLRIKLEELQTQSQSLQLQIVSNEPKLLTEVKPKTIDLVESPTQEIAETLVIPTLTSNQLPQYSLPPLPIPAPPPLLALAKSSTFSSLTPDQPSVSSSVQLEPKVEVEIPLPQVSETSDEPSSDWLGQTSTVYFAHSSSSNNQVEEQSTSQPIAQSEESLLSELSDQDLNQYLIFPSPSKKQSDQSQSSISESIEVEQPLTQNQDLQTTAEENFQPQEQLATSISDDDDLALYLDSTDSLTNSENLEVQEIAESELKAEQTKHLNQENTFKSDSDIVTQIPKKQPLFDDEDLRKYLTTTPLYSNDILKQKLN